MVLSGLFKMIERRQILYFSLNRFLSRHSDVVVKFVNTVLSSTEIGQTLGLILERERVVNNACATLATDAQTDQHSHSR